MGHTLRRIIELLCLCAFLLLTLSASLVHAQGTASVTQYATRTATNSSLTATGFFSTAGGACEVFRASADSWSTGSAPHTYRIDYTGTTPTLCNIINKLGGVSYSGGFTTQLNNVALPCPASGTKEIRNFTAGYSNSPNSDQVLPTVTPPGVTVGQSTCMAAGGGSCSVTVTRYDSSYSSVNPTATGLYRISDDYEVTHTGNSCTPSAAESQRTDATSAPPLCPGTYGTVNGKAVCLPSSPGTTAPPAGFGKNKAGNPAAGSSGADIIGNRSPATGTNNGNNGSAPSGIDGQTIGARGTGVTVTPGGTSSGSGTGATNDDAKTCGLPGRPPCKMDETGTPTSGTNDGQGALTDGHNTLNDTLNGIKDGTGKDTSWGIIPTWIQASESCHPVVLMTLPEKLGSKQITFDICPYMDKIYLLMNMLWVVWTFGAVISMVFRVTSAGVS